MSEPRCEMFEGTDKDIQCSLDKGIWTIKRWDNWFTEFKPREDKIISENQEKEAHKQLGQ